MPGIGVAQNLIEHVAAARMVPQVMMRIDDRQVRLEGRLTYFRQPRFSFLFGVRHNHSPLNFAGRFSRNARTPSPKSAELPALRCI